jgi:hypothetical protein
MKLSGYEINSQVRQKLQMPTGRHLYVVLGTYDRLERFEKFAFREARSPTGQRLDPPLNVGLSLLQRISDADLKWLVRNEAILSETVKKRLSGELDSLVDERLASTALLALKHLEILFAYDLEMNCLRIRATNQKHILILLAGERVGDRIALFHEAQPHNHRTLPANLAPENHLWELSE